MGKMAKAAAEHVSYPEYDAPITARERFSRAYRAVRLMKHKYAATAAFNRLPADDMLRYALKCIKYPDGYHTSGGVWFARQAAKNGRSFKTAIRIYLRAAKYRRFNRMAAA